MAKGDRKPVVMEGDLEVSSSEISQAISEAKTEAISTSESYADDLNTTLAGRVTTLEAKEVEQDNAITAAIATAESYADTNYSGTKAEVIDAETDVNGTVYTTLKNRLDAEQEAVERNGYGEQSGSKNLWGGNAYQVYPFGKTISVGDSFSVINYADSNSQLRAFKDGIYVWSKTIPANSNTVIQNTLGDVNGFCIATSTQIAVYDHELAGIPPYEPYFSSNKSISNIIGNDVWDYRTAYTVGQYVIYNNTLYRCIVANSNVVPTNTTYWTETSVQDALENLCSRAVTYKNQFINAAPTFDFTNMPSPRCYFVVVVEAFYSGNYTKMSQTMVYNQGSLIAVSNTTDFSVSGLTLKFIGGTTSYNEIIVI